MNDSAVKFVKEDISDKLAALYLYDINITMDESLPFGKGYMRTMEDNELRHLHITSSINIGIQGIDESNLSAVFRLYKIAGHEFRHVQQEMMMASDDTEFVYQMSLNTVCRIGYPVYYKDNYRLFIREIDADQYGLMYAFNLFEQMYGNDVAVKYRDLYSRPVMDGSTLRNCENLADIPVFDDMMESSTGTQQDEILAKYFFEQDTYARNCILLCTPSLCHLWNH